MKTYACSLNVHVYEITELHEHPINLILQLKGLNILEYVQVYMQNLNADIMFLFSINYWTCM